MNAETPREIFIEYAKSRADLDAFMIFVSEKGEGQPLTFDAFYTPSGWQVIMICDQRAIVHRPAQARKLSREMREALRRKYALASVADRAAANLVDAYAICEAWDSRAKLALERNFIKFKPN